MSCPHGNHHDGCDICDELDATNRQVEILSDALAESRREVAALEAVQEPVAWVLTAELDKRETTTRAHLWFSDPVNCMWTPIYTTPPAAPVQEPVALEMDGKQLTLGEALDEAIAATERSASKRLNKVLVAAKNALYTTPPAQEIVCSTGLCHFKAQRTWVGLTDNEKIDCASPYDSRLCCVEATEAKLKEKNNG